MARNVGVPLLTMMGALAAFAADAPSVAKVWDSQLKNIESEMVSLVEAVPPEKFSFRPSAGEFKTSRTFGQQATHAATIVYMVSAVILGEKNPVESGKDENGAASLQSKDAVVKYVKDAFTYGHKAMNSLTRENEYNLVKSAFGNNEVARIYMASVALWHSLDHYGQMAIYARMNGIVPPASR